MRPVERRQALRRAEDAHIEGPRLTASYVSALDAVARLRAVWSDPIDLEKLTAAEDVLYRALAQHLDL